MRVIVAGSRSIDDFDIVKYGIEIGLDMLDIHISELVSGRAKGVDITAEHWANSVKLPIKPFPADWDRYGKRAGFIRNRQMAKYADALIAIWDEESKGTQHMIDMAIEYDLPYYVIKWKKK